METVKAVELLYNGFTKAWGNRATICFNNNAFTPPEFRHWCRLFITHEDTLQTSLSNAHGKKRYTRKGLLYAQAFFQFGKGAGEAYNVCEEVVNALRKECNPVILRNINAKEIGPDGALFQFAITAQFEYDQVR